MIESAVVEASHEARGFIEVTGSNAGAAFDATRFGDKSVRQVDLWLTEQRAPTNQ